MEDKLVNLGNMNENKKNPGRQAYFHEGRQIYEWDQSLEEVFIYIKAPDCLLEKNIKEIKKNLKPGEQPPKLEVNFKPDQISIGLKGLPPYINEPLAHKIKTKECFWMLDGDEITVTLIKAMKAETWLSVFINHNKLNVLEKEELQKKLLLERFQEEHGGFDFSDAQINGNVPDPRTFMGGIK